MVKRGRTIIGQPKPRFFIDSSVLFTAVNSASGGSSKLLSLSGTRYIVATSPLVLAETERNVRAKLTDFAVKRFFMLVERLTILYQHPNPKIIQQARKAIVAKDAVILAEAKQAGVDFLVTLDKKHFMQPSAKKFVRPAKIVSPKEILTNRPIVF